MRVGVIQRNFSVGAFEANVAKIRDAYVKLSQQGADLVLTPEQALGGYPAHDLLDRPEFFERGDVALAELTRLTSQYGAVLAVGHVARNSSPQGRSAQNMVSVLKKGQVAFTQAKTLLPTYDVFDEARYFEPAANIQAWTEGKSYAFAICEDLWGGAQYSTDPVAKYEALGVDAVFALSASPYEIRKARHREDIHCQVAKRLKRPLIYANSWGATDELLFDGQSLVINARGQVVQRLKAFEDDECVVDLASLTLGSSSEPHADMPVDYDLLTKALVCGIRDYFRKTGFKSAILGLSGGIDSALVAVLAVEALGAENVLGIAMPGPFSSAHSLEDAQDLAKRLGCRFEVRPIKFAYSSMLREMPVTGLAQENLQARLRGLTLMTMANQLGALVLNTSNKSECAVGYSTQYGDLIGALSPIGDLYKTRVFELSQHLNHAGSLRVPGIPERTMTKAPSAELRPNQTDQDSLPPYAELDAVFEEYLELKTSIKDIRAKYQFAWLRDETRAKHLFTMIEQSEFKRRQAPPVLKVTPRAFGPGRRWPIAKEWKTF